MLNAANSRRGQHDKAKYLNYSNRNIREINKAIRIAKTILRSQSPMEVLHVFNKAYKATCKHPQAVAVINKVNRLIKRSINK